MWYTTCWVLVILIILAASKVNFSPSNRETEEEKPIFHTNPATSFLTHHGNSGRYRCKFPLSLSLCITNCLFICIYHVYTQRLCIWMEEIRIPLRISWEIFIMVLLQTFVINCCCNVNLRLQLLVDTFLSIFFKTKYILINHCNLKPWFYN